ncbi:MAG: PrsW family intramembrane metalloprotease [Blastocatellia bacterium]|nr:PrsW family intramembrane metalloprotease [Blastocatellia bacterium]
MKLVMTIGSGTLAGRQFTLTSGFLTIGRADSCTVRFDPKSERIASKQHAFIEAKADGFYLTDNKSTNGTLVNGKTVTSAKLASGDIIKFGRRGVEASISIEESDDATEDARVFPAPSVNDSFAQIGVGNVHAEAEREVSIGRVFFYIGLTATIVLMAFLGALLALVTTFNLGLVTALVATVVAFVPALIYILPLMWLDRYDPEPLWLLALAFAWGAIISIFFSGIVNDLVAAQVGAAISPQAGQFATYVISAPIFEESSKGIGVLLILLFFRKYFDDILDGIVFGGVVALGFATVENVMYYGENLLKEGWNGLALVFVLRGVFSPFIHVFFTSMTGIGCGVARETHNRFLKIAAPVIGYLFAVLLHALWNFIAFAGGALMEGAGLVWACEYVPILSGTAYQSDISLCAFGLMYMILQVPLFLILVGFALFIMRRQNRILRDMLAIDVARGLVPENHVKIATSAFRSTFWRIGGLFSGKYNHRRRYLRALGKLGLSYWHIQRARDASGQTASFQQNPILRAEVLKWKENV